MPRMSIPLLVVEALVLDRDHRLLDDRGDLAGVTITRFCWLSDADRVAEIVGEDRALARPCTARTSSATGRSDATATNMPKTNETRPSSRTAKRIARKRSLFRRVLRGGSAAKAGSGVCQGEPRRSSADRGLDQGRRSGRLRQHAWRETRHERPMRVRESTIAPRMMSPLDEAAELARSAVDSLPEGGLAEKLRDRTRRGPPAAGQARDRPDGARHPSRSRGRAEQAARVPGRRPPGGADRRRLHSARGRPVGSFEPAPDARRRGDRGQRGDLPGAGPEDPRPRPRAAGGQAQQRVAGHGDGRRCWRC